MACTKINDQWECSTLAEANVVEFDEQELCSCEWDITFGNNQYYVTRRPVLE